MAQKKFSSLFVALLVIVACHVHAIQAKNYAGINKWCLTADSKRLCTRMVKDASTLAGASVNAIGFTLVLAGRVKTYVPLLKSAIVDLEKQSQDSIMDTCTSDFDSKVDDLKDVLLAMASGDVGTVRAKLSGAYSSDCTDALDQFGIECPFAKIVRGLEKSIDNCLAIVQQN